MYKIPISWKQTLWPFLFTAFLFAAGGLLFKQYHNSWNDYLLCTHDSYDVSCDPFNPTWLWYALNIYYLVILVVCLVPFVLLPFGRNLIQGYQRKSSLGAYALSLLMLLLVIRFVPWFISYMEYLEVFRDAKTLQTYRNWLFTANEHKFIIDGEVFKYALLGITGFSGLTIISMAVVQYLKSPLVLVGFFIVATGIASQFTSIIFPGVEFYQLFSLEFWQGEGYREVKLLTWDPRFFMYYINLIFGNLVMILVGSFIYDWVVNIFRKPAPVPLSVG